MSQRVCNTLVILLGLMALIKCAIATDSQKPTEVLGERHSLANDFIVWSYGTGNLGTRDGELAGPHMAEENPFNHDEIVVAEQYGSDILIINRKTGKMRVLYGKRGIYGTGDQLSTAQSAHFMPSGPYQQNILITEYQGEHRVMIIDKDNGEILWHCTDFIHPLDAIYWDDEHIMVSASTKGIYKVRLKDGEQVWEYPNPEGGRSFYMQKIHTDNMGASYGGDLLIGWWSAYAVVREINTSDKSTVWEYGTDRGPLFGDLYDRLNCPVRPFRYGISEIGGGLTIIVDERSRIFCVDRDKNLIWDLGGATAKYRGPISSSVILPTYITTTTRGTLLITDWGLNMIYEINPFKIPVRKQKDAYVPVRLLPGRQVKHGAALRKDVG